MTETISGMAAWEGLLKNKHSRWSNDIARFSDSLATVKHHPKFAIEPSDSFFCLGSCFARNVEEHLIYNGMRVLSRKIVSPANEWGGARLNGFVNKFTALSMLNELEWVVERPEVTKDFFEPAGDLWRDLQLSTGIPAVSLERAIERRNYLTSDYFARVERAEIVVMTLGLNETWFDSRTQRYLNEAPTVGSVRANPDRYRIEITDVGTNLEALRRINRRLRILNPNVRIIVTVSPVPMFATFTGKDVATANSYSKSVLRAAAEEFAAEEPLADYFPSYDMVMLSPRSAAFAGDCLHVSDQVVSIIIRHFLRLYTGIEPVVTDFSEVAYLAANSDVEDAVRRGELDSGFQHWKAHGQTEGRPMRPPPGAKLDLIVGVGA